MSKITELKEKFAHNVSTSIFNSFVEADTTETKKYVEFMCILWVNRYATNISRSSRVIKIVQDFNDHIKYLENKDIYSPEYRNFSILTARLEDAITKKQLKEFDRDKHGIILLEDENTLLVRPLTVEGSNKWGAATKWCTTGSNYNNRFQNYFKDGTLIYLIDKKNTKKNNLNKIAFYLKSTNDRGALFGNYEAYNQLDTLINDNAFFESGWSMDTLFNVMSIIRMYTFNLKRVSAAKTKVSTALAAIKRIDMDEILDSISIIQNSKIEKDTDYIDDIKATLDLLKTKLADKI